jgi:hypothetical protein
MVESARDGNRVTTMSAIRNDGTRTITPLLTDPITGGLITAQSSSAINFVYANTSNASANTIVSATTGKRIRVMSFTVSFGAATTCFFQDGLTSKFAILASANSPVSNNSTLGLFETAVGQPLNVVSTSATLAHYSVSYILI